jgi:long-chain acyl-CoA synthetase
MRASVTALLERVIRDGRMKLDGPSRKLDAAGLQAIGTRVAHNLTTRGVVAAEPVVALIGNRPEDVGTLLGIWRAGAVPVPVNASAPSAVHALVKGRAGARFTMDLDRVEGLDGRRGSRAIHQDAALVIFTSGSTGHPKGVVIGHERFAGKMAVLERMLLLRGDDTVLVPLQLTFIFGLWVTLLGMLAGARVILMPRFSVGAMSEALGGGATVAGVVPTMLRSLVLQASPPAPALRMLLSGGEPLGAPLAAKIGAAYRKAELFDLYGSTETGSCDFCLHCREAAHHGSIGAPTEGVEFRVIGEDGRPVATGETGELRIRTPYGMLGYLDDPELTVSAFDDGFFRTGDLARVQAEGMVELVGRRKDIISRGGVKISPLELDRLFAKHPDVEAALCGAVPDERVGEAVHVLIVGRKGAKLEARELKDWAAERVERDKIPDAIHFVEELPVGNTGKADRGAVARFVHAGGDA